MEMLLEETKISPTSRERAKGLALDAVLEKIKENEEYHGRNFKIARYTKRSSASGAQSTLKGKYGHDATCDGYTFGVAPDDDEAHKGEFVLIASYDPSQIVEGELAKSQAEYQAKEKDKQERYAKAKADKKAAAASAATATDVTSGATANGPSADPPPPVDGPAPAAANQPTAKANAQTKARQRAGTTG